MQDSIVNDLVMMLTGEKAVEKLNWFNVGQGGRTLDSGEAHVFVDDSEKGHSIHFTRKIGSREHKGRRDEESRTYCCPLSEPFACVIAYLPKRRRFKFYFRKSSDEIMGAIAHLHVWPDPKGHVMNTADDDIYYGAWKIMYRWSSVLPTSRLSHEDIIGLLDSDSFYESFEKQIERYFRLGDGYRARITRALRDEHVYDLHPIV